MAKTHLYLDFGPRFDEIIATQPISKAKFVKWAVEKALDEYLSGRSAIGTATVAPTPPAAATKAPAASAGASRFGFNLKVIKGGDKVPWFPIAGVCEVLNVSQASVLNQLDLDEDTQTLAGELHVADLGVSTALAVAAGAGTDPALMASFEAWAQAQ